MLSASGDRSRELRPLTPCPGALPLDPTEGSALRLPLYARATALAIMPPPQPPPPSAAYGGCLSNNAARRQRLFEVNHLAVRARQQNITTIGEQLAPTTRQTSNDLALRNLP